MIDALCRSDFPQLERAVGGEGQRLAYLDTAATCLSPRCVVDAAYRYELTSRSNVHRAFHLLAEESTDAYELARESVASFIGAGAEQLVLTHGTTDSVNIAMRSWACERLREGDVVVAFEDSHNANLLPWQIAARERGLRLEVVPVHASGPLEGMPDERAWETALAHRPKLVALTHVSNVTGRIEDISARSRQAKAVGARVFVDCAQSVGHLPVDVKAWDADFVAFSAHKMYGLAGMGALWCSQSALDKMVPAVGGGGIAASVTSESFLPLDAPACFEPGTPAVGAAVAFAEACRFLEAIGRDRVARHDTALVSYARERLAALPGVCVLGGSNMQSAAVVSFSVEGVHAHDVAQVLSQDGVAVRSGKHCAMLLHERLGIPASVRASMGVYASSRDVDRLIAGVEKAVIRFGRGHGHPGRCDTRAL